MAYKDEEESESTPAYDLRQIYAEFLGATLRDIRRFRSIRDYKNWYEELDGLYIDISCYLNDEHKYYFKLVKELNELIRENPKAYMERTIESEAIHKKLRQINIFLMRMLREYDLLGSKPGDYEEGL